MRSVESTRAHDCSTSARLRTINECQRRRGAPESGVGGGAGKKSAPRPHEVCARAATIGRRRDGAKEAGLRSRDLERQVQPAQTKGIRRANLRLRHPRKPLTWSNNISGSTYAIHGRSGSSSTELREVQQLVGVRDGFNDGFGCSWPSVRVMKG